MTQQKLCCLFSISLCAAVFATGCDTQTYRDSLNQSNDSFTKARRDEMLPAVGSYQGTMKVALSDKAAQNFDCLIEVDGTSEVIRVSQPTDPAEAVEFPELKGSMRFPVLDNIALEDLASYSMLTAPMGGYLTVRFNSGYLNPRTSKLILPYTVPGDSHGSLGQLEGTLTNGRYSGTWYSDQIVGTFDLVMTERTKQ